MDCVFCKIASGEVESEKLHETDEVYVIKDMSPQAPVHLLIIPRKHYPTLLDIDDDAVLAEMLKTAQIMAKKFGVAETGFRTVINTNDEGGQIVFHLHMHLIGGKELGGRMG